MIVNSSMTPSCMEDLLVPAKIEPARLLKKAACVRYASVPPRQAQTFA